jgi:hypothetical protein
MLDNERQASKQAINQSINQSINIKRVDNYLPIQLPHDSTNMTHR